MSLRKRSTSDDLARKPISPFVELGAYEALWEESGASFKSLSKRFADAPGALPSHFVGRQKAQQCAEQVSRRLLGADSERFGVCIHGTPEYPARLRHAAYPVELLYFRGLWDLAFSQSVAIVGTRNPSPEGRARTRRLVRELVKDDFTIVSGLAAGIDTAAHEAAFEFGGRTIAVIGTPLSHVYPKQNAELQRKIAREFLVISQVPVCRYERQDYRMNRLFFPERNVTMSALTQATVIVEAGETSGTLIQARAALHQGRKLFILDNCFKDPRLTWPEKFAKKGAIRVRDIHDIRRHLSAPVRSGQAVTA